MTRHRDKPDTPGYEFRRWMRETGLGRLEVAAQALGVTKQCARLYFHGQQNPGPAMRRLMWVISAQGTVPREWPTGLPPVKNHLAPVSVKSLKRFAYRIPQKEARGDEPRA